MTSRTIWVLGDQLNRDIGALATADPSRDRVLLIESDALLSGQPYHRQRLHFVIASMRRFGGELAAAGFAVDHRSASTFGEGVAAHRKEYGDPIIATEPNGREMRSLLDRLGVEQVRSNQFLTHPDEFADWAGDRPRLRMEDFYRWQRRRLGYLMDGDEPAGGRWNYDAENRQPPPRSERPWPPPPLSRLDELDREVIAALPPTAVGADPVGWWATSRRAALNRLRHFVDRVLPMFGPHEDAMLSDNWHLAHSMLSPYLNVGLLLPGEVCDRVEDAYREGRVPIASAEGFIRQVIGWREFIWGIYWRYPDQRDANALGNDQPLPPAFAGTAPTDMECVSSTLADLDERSWVHHIPRLMVLANVANLFGIEPGAVHDWMRQRFVDAANWVMGPNVMGMGMWADGGLMSTKPYVSGGAYINRMSDYCRGCRFDPKKRVGDDACPFTTLYWDFLDRHREVLGTNHRVARQYATLDRLSDLEELRERAALVIGRFGDGEL
ncbi:MAG: cryptochrome/photolyase family protein [Acidimicrobiia bacterium]|nr:cryptochrome/photolyase family protein [Acidimicrobiia bacterium]